MNYVLFKLEGRFVLSNKFRITNDNFENGDINGKIVNPSGTIHNISIYFGQSAESSSVNKSSSNLGYNLKTAIDSTFMPLR